MRSVWKSKVISLSYSEGKNKVVLKPQQLFCPSLEQVRVRLYNGRVISSMLVRPFMFGQRISSFIRTKRTGIAIHVKKSVKKGGVSKKVNKK